MRPNQRITPRALSDLPPPPPPPHASFSVGSQYDDGGMLYTANADGLLSVWKTDMGPRKLVHSLMVNGWGSTVSQGDTNTTVYTNAKDKHRIYHTQHSCKNLFLITFVFFPRMILYKKTKLHMHCFPFFFCFTLCSGVCVSAGGRTFATTGYCPYHSPPSYSLHFPTNMFAYPSVDIVE